MFKLKEMKQYLSHMYKTFYLKKQKETTNTLYNFDKLHISFIVITK